MSEPNETPIPYDPEWWADFNRRCNELTPEDIAGMVPEPPVTKHDRPGKAKQEKPRQ